MAPLQPATALELLERAELGLFLVQDHVICYINPAMAAMLGTTADRLLGQPNDVFVAPDYRPHVEKVVDRRLSGHEGRWGEMKCLCADGTLKDMRVYARGIQLHERPAVLVTMQDISELRAAVRSAEWNAQILARTEALARIGSLEVSWPVGRVKLSNGLQALLGIEGAVATEGADTLETLAWVPAEEREYVAGIWRSAVQGEPFEFQHRVRCPDGRRLTVLHRGALLPQGSHGQIGVALLQDITAQRAAEQRIQELASQDEVTGLPNRAALLDQTEAAMLAARWDDRAVVLLVVEVPQIGTIKTTMGFGAGDTLAMALAARLREACLTHETAGQTGDAEFTVVIEMPGEIDEAALRQRATDLLARLSAPVRLGATDVFPRGVAGLAIFPRDADTPAALLEAAQAARLDAGGDTVLAFFRPEVTQRAVRAMRIEGGLRRAIAAEELTLHYQPQVDLVTGAIRGAEALLRWQSPDLGAVSPGEFIPIAERSGLSGAIGAWVLEAACRDLADWQRRGLPGIQVSINLSSAELQRPDLAAQVQRVLQSHGVDARRLSIELTESMVMADLARAAQVLHDLKALGVEIALDDFGTGFSSLSYLCRLPIDVVKVDRSFVHDVTAPVEEVSVTRAIINLAHDLKMQVLAEGVETEGQLSLLASNGCDHIQGFWFSRPVPAAEFEAMLVADKRLPAQFLAQRTRTRTLLVVDDEENIVASLRRLLRRDGYQIVTANSGEEGLRRLAEHEVDVILSDQRMPGMTGVEFLHRAKALYPQTVRMVLSGYTELQSIIDAVNEGAIYKFLTKPWDDERLREHVAEAFRQKELSDENRRLARQVATANADLATLNHRLEALLGRQREHADLLAASADNLRQLVEELPAPVVAVDPDGQIVFVNTEAAVQLSGAAGWIGQCVQAVWPMPLAALACGADSAGGAGARHTLDLDLDGQRYAVHRRCLPPGAHSQSTVLLFQSQASGTERP